MIIPKIKIKVQKVFFIFNIVEINKIPKEDNLLKSKRENKEYTKIKMKNDNLSKFMRKSTKNNMKKSH